MQTCSKILITSLFAAVVSGCVVHEEPPVRPVYAYESPAPHVVVIPVQPEADMVWERGWYTHDERNWLWHDGYWRHTR